MPKAKEPEGIAEKVMNLPGLKDDTFERQEEFVEYGILPETARPHKVIRPFRLPIKAGPPETIPKGAVVSLSPQTAIEMFFARKVEPLEVGRYFKAVRPFIIIQQGEWLPVDKDDVLELERNEAVPLLREQKIKEISKVR